MITSLTNASAAIRGPTEEETENDTTFNAEMHCIACSKKILENSHSCACGHVHGVEKKLIRGKRYSVYREELYSKLTEQELLEVATNKTRKNASNTRNYGDITEIRRKPFKQRNSNSQKHRRRKKHGGHVKHARGTTMSAATLAKKKSENYWASHCNFSFALEEINRRFLKQSLFWVRL